MIEPADSGLKAAAMPPSVINSAAPTCALCVRSGYFEAPSKVEIIKVYDTLLRVSD